MTIAVLLPGCGENQTTLVLEHAKAPSVTGPVLDRLTVAELELRLVVLGTRSSEVKAVGGRYEATFPARLGRAAERVLTSAGNVGVYDWEPNVIGKDGKVDPDAQRYAGGPSPLAFTPADADRAARKWRRRVVKLRPEQPLRGKPPERCYVLLDGPVLTAEDIDDTMALGGDNPTVSLTLRPEAHQRYSELTRAVAQRGADEALPGADPASSAHHMAIVVDDRILATPFIDYRENPDGIAGDQGVLISGGFTEASARELAATLAGAALPGPLRVTARK